MDPVSLLDKSNPEIQSFSHSEDTAYMYSQMPTDSRVKHIQFSSTFSHKQSEINQSTGKLTNSKNDLHD